MSIVLHALEKALANEKPIVDLADFEHGTNSYSEAVKLLSKRYSLEEVNKLVALEESYMILAKAARDITKQVLQNHYDKRKSPTKQTND